MALFDHRRGVKFSTYAVWWIRRSMHDALASSKVIRVPRQANRQFGGALRAAPQVVASLEEPVGDGTTPLGDLIADTRAVDPSDLAIAREEREGVSAMLRFLPDRHREVLVRRYGLDGSAVQTHREIGRSLGVGDERTRQIEQEALRRLRAVAETLARAA